MFIFFRKTLVFFLVTLLLSMIIPSLAMGETLSPFEPDISAVSAILIDADTAQVLWSKNSKEARAPASLTKMMTAIVVLEKADLKDQVTISEEAAAVGESEIWLSAGEVLSVEDLLYAALIFSANDAAVALAEHVAGSEDRFVQLMNEKAREIGASQTNFVNATGLDAEEHLSTAYDLALIARYAMQDETFAKIVATKEWTIPSAGHEDRPLKNLNALLDNNHFITGVKTGYTEKAGWCMAASGTRDGKNLISIILGSENQDLRGEDALAVLNYGFNNFEREKIIDQEVSTFLFQPSNGATPIKVAPQEDLWVLLPKDKKATVTARYMLMQDISDPLSRGEKIGEISLWMGDDLLGQEDLVSLEQISETQQAERGKATPEQRSASLSYPDYAVLAAFALLLLLSILRLLRLVLRGH